MVDQDLKKSVLVVIILSCFNHNMSEALQNLSDTPISYFGIQGDVRQINLKENFGNPLFKNNFFPETGLFLGGILNKNIGYELGYQTTISKKHQKTIRQGQFLPGSPASLGEGEFRIYQVKQRLESLDLGLVGYTPPFCDNTLFGTVGVSFSKIRAKMQFIGDQFPFAPDEDEINAYSRTFQQKKIIPFAKIGIQHEMNNHINMRFFLDWRNLSKFKIKANYYANQTYDPILKYKNSLGIGVGISYHW